LGALGNDASIMSIHSLAGRLSPLACSSTNLSMDFCGNSMEPVGMERPSLSVPSAPEPWGVGKIEGGPCKLSAPESWIFFHISSDVLPLPLEVVGFALLLRARFRGEDSAFDATVVVFAPALGLNSLNISANCCTLKDFVGSAVPCNN
jgi:hypothetical protein